MEFVEQLKASVDIVRVVSEYVPRLRKKGSRWEGLCPFHTEKSPSFGVNETHGFYKCFGCGAGGDMIKFVMEMERIGFFEALKLLSERYGIPMPKRQEYSDPDSRVRGALFEIHEIAAEQFRQNLFGPNGGAARAYLEKRGVARQTAEEFGLGLAEKSWDAVLRLLQNKGFSPETIEQAGLAVQREGGGYYDRFRGRLMFPIHNESGKVIGFGGRALSPEDEPKYLNSKETPLYHKSFVLYNLHRAKKAAHKAGRFVLVEGYMDVVGVAAAGIGEVVASCGTALTDLQVRSMRRHAERMLVNFDPDAAGAAAAEKSIQMLLDEGMRVRIVQLDGGLDPDEYVKERGVEAYRARLEGAGTYFHWLADQSRQRYDMRSAEGRMEGFRKMLLPAFQRLHDKLERVAVANEMADYLGLDRVFVLEQLRRNGLVDQRRGRAPGPAAGAPALPAVEKLLFEALLASGDACAAVLPRLKEMKSLEGFRTRKLFEVVLGLWERGIAPSYGEIESRLDESDRDLLAKLILADEVMEHSYYVEQAEACVRSLEAQERSLERALLKERIRTAERSGDLKEALKLSDELVRLDRAGAANAGGNPVV
ncbi:MAG TPA: DNA primase [Solibacterales bacterium]|nr:DNA primase [Bryobacterales bacterium]